jgi:hypothetical protein
MQVPTQAQMQPYQPAGHPATLAMDPNMQMMMMMQMIANHKLKQQLLLQQLQQKID